MPKAIKNVTLSSPLKSQKILQSLKSQILPPYPHWHILSFTNFNNSKHLFFLLITTETLLSTLPLLPIRALSFKDAEQTNDNIMTIDQCVTTSIALLIAMFQQIRQTEEGFLCRSFRCRVLGVSISFFFCFCFQATDMRLILEWHMFQHVSGFCIGLKIILKDSWFHQWMLTFDL